MTYFLSHFTMLAIGVFLGLLTAVYLEAYDWQPKVRLHWHAYETPV